MEVCEESSTDTCINADILEEINVVKTIYEGQISSAIVDNQVVAVTLSDAKLLITFHINRNYPEEVPQIKVLSYNGEKIGLINVLETCACENHGNPMLYILISKAFDIISTIESNDSSLSPAKTQCMFYMEGKCKFGDKCFNLHGTLSGTNVDLHSEENMDCESTSVVSDKSHVSDSDALRSPRRNTDKTSDAVHDKKRKSPKADLHVSEKKKSMKTAIDVINRILWDDSFPTENFIVGYLDRFLGVQEKPFNAFSWEDIASVDYNVLAIPKHRIQYFKYKSVVIWDKNERLDKVFGSTGDSISVMDIINNESISDININNSNNEEEDEHNVYYNSANRPNYFMVLRVRDEEVKQNIVKEYYSTVTIGHKIKMCEIERVKNISVEVFEERYLNGNRPLIIENYIDEWPSRRWTLSTLKEKAGHNEVFVRRKTASEFYKAGLKYNIESMEFSEYINNIEDKNSKSYDSYLAVQNIRKALPELEDDLRIPEYIKKLHGGPYLWIAQKGHYEFCHFDPHDNFLIVLSGEKHLKLYPPADLHNLYPNKLGSKGKTIQSSINCTQPDLVMFPKFANATCYECIMKEGEMLFFPAFWWHQVTSTEQTISINIFFGNDGDNEYLSRIMCGDQWEPFRYWLLNIVEQNKNKSQFQMVLRHLEESLKTFLLKQWHEIPVKNQLDILVATILEYCNLDKIPESNEKKKHPPPLKIRGLLWR